MVWFVFGQTIHHEFVNFDDDTYVYNNPEVKGGLNSQAIAWAFTHVHSSNWHPLTWLTHMLDCQWYHLDPAGHHLTNVLLHAATAILLFLVLWQITSPRKALVSPANPGSANKIKFTPASATALWGSAFVAAVFAVHPLRVESVAWVAERKDVLSGLFFMLTLGAYARYARQPKSLGRYLTVALMLALALMSKSMVVTLPFVLLLLDYWPLRRVSGVRCQVSGARCQVPDHWPEGLHLTPDTWHLTPLSRLILEKIPLLLLCAAVCAVTLISQQKAMSSLPLLLRVENALVSSVLYLKQMFYPAGLAVLYPFPVAGIALWKIITAAILLLAISIGAVIARHKQPWFLVGWLWYLGMLAPVIGIVQVGAQARADRYTYLPQIGLTILLTWTIADVFAGWRHRRMVLGAAGAVVLGALMVSARKQTVYWRNNESLWTHTLACTSDNFIAHDNYGNALLDQGHVDESIPEFQLALQAKPDHAEAHYNLANALVRKGRTDEAIFHYQQALQLKPDDPKTHCNLGIAFLQKGNVDEAIVQLRRTVQLKPDDVAARNTLGNALFQKGNLDEAIAQFQMILRVNPEDVGALCNLGIALFQKGNTNEAVARLRKAVQLKPEEVVIRNNLGNLLLETGDLDAAISEFEKILRLQPDHVAARNSLGSALVKKGQLNEAISAFQKSLAGAPNSAETEFALASALLQAGRENEAIPHFQRALQLNPGYPEAQNDLAWELATSPQASLRDGKKAVELAERANQVAQGRDVDVLDSLAAAYAEARRYEEAVHTAQSAIELARAGGKLEQATQIGDRLKLYQAGRPFHREAK
jgi:Flp pilus assembly protein TadD